MAQSLNEKDVGTKGASRAEGVARKHLADAPTTWDLHYVTCQHERLLLERSAGSAGAMAVASRQRTDSAANTSAHKAANVQGTNVLDHRHVDNAQLYRNLP
jgi:hypothetical protein